MKHNFQIETYCSYIFVEFYINLIFKHLYEEGK